VEWKEFVDLFYHKQAGQLLPEEAPVAKDEAQEKDGEDEAGWGDDKAI
jgi:hypothetical protein